MRAHYFILFIHFINELFYSAYFSLPGNYEVLNFGHCHVDCPYQESFTMTNHSSSHAVKFEWPPAGPHICFSPQVQTQIWL